MFFGHYTVTVPPPGYTDAAHEHGVKVLGTLIFEWERGGLEAETMLSGRVASEVGGLGKEAPGGNRHYARKLMEVA